MEFEDVEEKIEWEARRLGAAFDSAEVSVLRAVTTSDELLATQFSMSLPCPIVLQKVEQADDLRGHLGERMNSLSFRYYKRRPLVVGNNIVLCSLLHRALFRLGYESIELDQRLKCSLSAHEKLELRLSLPREFWPQKWLDEQAVEKQ